MANPIYSIYQFGYIGIYYLNYKIYIISKPKVSLRFIKLPCIEVNDCVGALEVKVIGLHFESVFE